MLLDEVVTTEELVDIWTLRLCDSESVFNFTQALDTVRDDEVRSRARRA